MGAGSGGRVRFDHGPRAGGTLFAEAAAVIRAETPDDLAPAFEAMEAARAAGKWLAGYASYELGYLMTDRLRPLLPEDRPEPLLQFGVFDAPRAPEPLQTGPLEPGQGGSGFSEFVPDWDFDRYRAAFDQVKELIAAGDIYQANLTFALRARVDGTPEALYRALAARQPVPYGALVDLGGPVLLSRSPELFFRVDAAGRIETRPMKGTLPRAGEPEEDARRRAWLAADPKNRAENLMIVDLLRNDLSRVSEIGSVRVPELFKVESFATVHQMTSHITAQLLPDWTLAGLFEALFPCGSVTGAPKIRAMEILRELETGPRGAYCGAIGWIAPSGAMEFNVAIRTIVLPGDGTARLNVGGGVVYDSTAETEYEEALWKTRFATSLTPS
ncbi:aminodeoxychorismate synthase component I [Thioclava atlantica]|uniref:Aminodeoxychorismate synthase n=1 Tax=Thioclava atlantica TaxID=1317124 RepID=A0A085U007_9RHOB|nr:aminodeoxychorismate synthase component I [Thioclava atlantica]KFE36304.1 aminodeoxychorismate synthase [Thioclava atlantica]